MNRRTASVILIILSQVLALSLWFSVSSAIPQWQAEFGISDTVAGFLTSAVQIGFVAGTIISAFLGLADRLNERYFFAAAAFLAATANLAILALDPRSGGVIAMRFITGLAMAGIYPVGMKLMTTWARNNMGLMVGLLVGAVTFGSASPHLFSALGQIDWRFTLKLASGAAFMAGILILFVEIGPNTTKAVKFHPSIILTAWKKRSLLLANLGYLGHMWELYAMWAWIGVFLSASFALTYDNGQLANIHAAYLTFATVAIGAVGSVLGGIFADRMGRTSLTILAMAISGTCALGIGFLFGGSPLVLTIICLIWGMSVVADSAQFSASIAELSDPETVGTMLTVQTSLGFLLTLVTIQLMPYLVDLVSWRYAFAVLAIGPYLGVVAMARLRAHPDAMRLAGGRK